MVDSSALALAFQGGVVHSFHACSLIVKTMIKGFEGFLS